MSLAINGPAELLPSVPPPLPEPPQVAPVAAASEGSGVGDDAQAGLGSDTGAGTQDPQAGEEDATRTVREEVTAAASATEQALTQAQQQELQELRARDREVRAHEAAHAAAAGGLARGAPSYSYVRGPDGRQYAVGGEVHIDTAPIAGDPRATLEKAQQIQRAALAPGEPSAQDRAVAAAAAQMAAEARQELADTSELTCPECGGDHDAAAHRGLATYAEVALEGVPAASAPTATDTLQPER